MEISINVQSRGMSLDSINTVSFLDVTMCLINFLNCISATQDPAHVTQTLSMNLQRRPF